MLAVKDIPNADLAADAAPPGELPGDMGRHRRPQPDLPVHARVYRPDHQRRSSQPRRRPGAGPGRGLVLPAWRARLRPEHRLLLLDPGGGPAEPGTSDTVQGSVTGSGQVWAYQTRSNELQLLYQSPGPDALDFPDNVTTSRRGTLVLCEDNINDNYIRGLTSSGKIFDIALNRLVSSTGNAALQRRVRWGHLQPRRAHPVRQHPGQPRPDVRDLGALAQDRRLSTEWLACASHDRGATMDDQTAVGEGGPEPPPEPARADPMAGELVTETFEYDGGRQVTVYVPPDPPEAVVFAGDGQLISQWGGFLEAADVPSTMIVGVHGLADETLRLHEYSPVFDAERFAAHEKFFVEDVRRWARSRFGVALPAERTAVFGVSAGGELALALGLRHPDIYGAIFCASPGGGYKPPGVMPSPIPRTYLVAGTQEPFFLENATRWADALRDAGADVVMTERVGSHGDAFWRGEFPLMVAWAFGR